MTDKRISFTKCYTNKWHGSNISATNQTSTVAFARFTINRFYYLLAWRNKRNALRHTPVIRFDHLSAIFSIVHVSTWTGCEISPQNPQQTKIMWSFSLEGKSILHCYTYHRDALIFRIARFVVKQPIVRLRQQVVARNDLFFGPFCFAPLLQRIICVWFIHKNCRYAPVDQQGCLRKFVWATDLVYQRCFNLHAKELLMFKHWNT